jgi:hypothetical protein
VIAKNRMHILEFIPLSECPQSWGTLRILPFRMSLELLLLSISLPSNIDSELVQEV